MVNRSIPSLFLLFSTVNHSYFNIFTTKNQLTCRMVMHSFCVFSFLGIQLVNHPLGYCPVKVCLIVDCGIVPPISGGIPIG